MNNLQPFQFYFTIFYLLGINAYVSFTEINKKCSKVMCILPRILNISIGLMVFRQIGESSEKDWNRLAFLSVVYVMIRKQFSTLVSVGENLFHIRLMRQTVKTLSFTIQVLKCSLNIEFPYKTFKRTIEKKLLLQMVLILVATVTKYIFLSTLRNLWAWRIEYAIYNVIKCANIFFVTFYVDFMTFTLKSLNGKLINMTSERNIFWCQEKHQKWLYIVHQMKLIHFQLWKISRNVNTMFGWFLIALMVELTTTSASQVLWAFTMVTNTDDVQFLRKYFIVFNLIESIVIH